MFTVSKDKNEQATDMINDISVLILLKIREIRNDPNGTEKDILFLFSIIDKLQVLLWSLSDDMRVETKTQTTTKEMIEKLRAVLRVI